MTMQYDLFMAEFKALCQKHDVEISTSGYDFLQVWNTSKCGMSQWAWERIEDRTGEDNA